MNHGTLSDVLPQFGTGAGLGLGWPTWLAVGGFVLFCLLGTSAALLVMAGRSRPASIRFLQPRSLRARLLIGFVLAATVPAVALALVLAERAAGQRLAAASLLLTAEAEALANRTEAFLDRAVAQLTGVAAVIPREPGDHAVEIQAPLLNTYRSLTGAYLIMVADTEGRVVASARRPGGAVDTGRFEAAADYFSQPLLGGEPYVSDQIPGPTDGDPRSAAIGVPIVGSAGSAAGVLVALYDLGDVSRGPKPLTERGGIRSVILDRAGQPIVDDADRDAALHAALDDPERYLAARDSLGNGWQAVAYQPRDEIVGPVLDQYAIVLAWALGALLIAICLAVATARSLSAPLAVVGDSMDGFDLNLNLSVPPPPLDAPAEVGAVFRQLAALEKRMRATYRVLRKSVQQGEKLRGELIYVIGTREKEIEQRTEELKQANQTLERLSREDSLTGLANRRWFAEFLARAWQGALRNQTPICVLIIDIDNFKAYNDTYGHQKGDKCLKLVAAAIRRTVGRASDLVSRYGGEEFIVVLGDTPLEGGLRVAENIRVAVEQLRIPHEGAQQHGCVTVSIGVTSTLPTRDTHPETVLVAADRAMYNAKNEGRNRVAYSTAGRTGIFQALCVPNEAATQPS